MISCSSIKPLSSISSSLQLRDADIMGLSIGFAIDLWRTCSTTAGAEGAAGSSGLEYVKTVPNYTLHDSSYNKSFALLATSVWRSMHSLKMPIRSIIFSARNSMSSQSQYIRSFCTLAQLVRRMRFVATYINRWWLKCSIQALQGLTVPADSE